MIKNYDNCYSCYYSLGREFCANSKCPTCEMNIFDEDNNKHRCKCNTIRNGEDCPYYKEADDETIEDTETDDE